MRQIILDTETTGLSAAHGHRMIEIAGIELVNRRPTGRQYHQYICPQRAIDAEAVAIHGLTEAFLADKPAFEQIAEELLAFLAGAELVIHNAPFDVSFLNSEFKQASDFKAITEYCRVVDTLALARKKHPGQPNNLDALCRRYKIDNSARDLHGALMDAHLLMQVYLAMTGGQTSLFGSEVEVGRSHDRIDKNAPQTATSVNSDLSQKVIKADMEELKGHADRLAVIQQLSGVCLWESESR